jgi:hypothetical protein
MTETATTTTIRDRARAPFARRPVWTVGAIAAVIHLAVATRYGWHQDEFAAGRGARMVTRETLFATADIVSLHWCWPRERGASSVNRNCGRCGRTPTW